MSISVACPECTKRLKAPERLAGQKVKCPTCQHSWRLPTPDGLAKPELPVADENRAASVTAVRNRKSTRVKRIAKKATSKSPAPKAKPPTGSRTARAKSERSQRTATIEKPRKPSEPPKGSVQAKPAAAKRPPLKPDDKPARVEEKKRSPKPARGKSRGDSSSAAETETPRSKTGETKPQQDVPLGDAAPSESAPSETAPVETASAELAESSINVAVETETTEETSAQPIVPLATPSGADLRWSNEETTKPAAASPTNGSSVATDSTPDASNSINEAPPLSLREMPVAPPQEPHTASPPADETPTKQAPSDSIDQWFVQSYVGDQFGPLIRDELDDWVTKGRLTGDCHVFQEGWTEWREARAVYPELEFVSADDDEVVLAHAESDKLDRTVSSSEPNWYTVRTGLSMISGSTVVGIVALVVLAVGFFVDRVAISQLYFDTMQDREIDPDHGGGLVSMVLVSWGMIGMFMSLVGILTGVIACRAIPRKTNLHPYVMFAVGATSLAVFTAVLMFTAAFLSLGPISKIVNVGSVLGTLLTATPWALLLCFQVAMASIVVLACMLAEFLNQLRIARQMRWFAGLQGGLLFWVLLDAAIIPDDSDGLFTFSLFIFLAALTGSLVWLAYITRSVGDAIRPS